MAMFHVVLRRTGPEWDRSRPMEEQSDWPAHASFMDGLVDEGFVVLGGPIGDGDGENTLLVIEAADEEAIRARLAADPWANDLLTIASIRPWSVWLRAAEASG